MFLFENKMASTVEDPSFGLCFVMVKPVVEKARSDETL